MERRSYFSNAHIADIHFVYGFCNGNASAAVREYRRRYPTRVTPNYRVFINIHRRISELGIQRTISSQAFRTVAPANEEMVLAEITRDPTSSVRRISLRLGLSKSSVWRILKKEGLHPYHFRRVQHLHEQDFRLRAVFSSWILRKIREIPDFARKIMWTDEATFTRAGITNLRNLHTWATENPYNVHPSSFQQQFSVNVWAAIIDDQLIGPIELPQIINAANFLEFLETTFEDLLEDVPLAVRRNMWLQLDGAPAHFAVRVREHLDSNFQQWIGRGGPVAWPPRSPDFTPLDFFLWGTMKQRVYATVINTRQELLERIHNVANEIRASPGLLRRTVQSVGLRATACLQSEGGYFENIMN